MRKFVLFSILALTFLSSCKNTGAEKNNGELTWLTIEQASTIGSGKNKKKFMIDVYTDWCGWCKVMDKKTFTDPEVIKYLNENFNVVKFNAEQKEAVTFKGKTYNWEPMGRNGVNALGVELLGGRMSYPTIVYLDEKLSPITISPGYKEPAQLIEELKSL
jgi:thioredoxin-related protein